MNGPHPASIKWSPIDIDDQGRIVTASGPDGWLLINTYRDDGTLAKQRVSRVDPETGVEVWQEYGALGELLSGFDGTAWQVVFRGESLPELGATVAQWGYRREASPRVDVWGREGTFSFRGDLDDPETLLRWLEWRRRMFGDGSEPEPEGTLKSPELQSAK